MWYVRGVLYAVLYVRVSCFVVRGCGVSRKYIDVCYCDMFSVVNVYLDHLCCLPTPMTLASGGSPMFPLVVHQPASPSIWPAVQSLRRGLSTNPGATMWCVCGCS